MRYIKKFWLFNTLIGFICVWRILLFLLAFFVQQLIPFIPQFPYSDIYLVPSGLPAWIWSWANFDGVHYLTIAKSGYSAQFTQAFFPLYPLMIKLIGGDEHNFIITGLIISFVALVIGISLFRQLLSLDYDTKTSYRTILFLLIFPWSFYFGALYTESLFFLLVIASFWMARNKYWRLSGICGGFAAATRITGIFLLPALLWEYYQVEIKNRSFNFALNKKAKFIHIIFSFLRSPILYLIPLGLVLYMLYLQLMFRDALYFWHAQEIFGAQRSGNTLIFPLQVVFRYFKILFSISHTSYGFWVALWEFGSVVVGLILLVIGFLNKIRLSYLFFAGLVILLPIFTGTFSSLPRYMLLAFPIHITLGQIKSKFVTSVIIAISVILLMIFTTLFLRGSWVA